MTYNVHVLALVLLCGILLQRGLPAKAADSPPTPASTASPTNSAAPATPGEAQNKPDVVAGQFAVMCAGCHSLTGAKLNGPELTPATAWPIDQLKVAIKRMEKNVGPLTDAQVLALAEFLKSPNVRERLKAEQDRIQAQFQAKMAPPDPVAGKRLFLGSDPLRNGGLACVACHTVSGVGGSLGPDLTGVFARVGGMAPLVSGIEQAAYLVMAPHYRRHPITTQEAMNLAKFFSTLTATQTGPAPASVVPVGGGVAAALLASLVFFLRKQRQNRGRDTRLQRRRK